MEQGLVPSKPAARNIVLMRVAMRRDFLEDTRYLSQVTRTLTVDIEIAVIVKGR